MIKKRLLFMMLLFIIAISAVMIVYNRENAELSKETIQQEQLIDINEILKLSERKNEADNQRLKQVIEAFRQRQEDKQDHAGNDMVWVTYGICIIFLVLVFSYIYIAIIRPFEKLQSYADEIARGNFDVSLKYERTNYFGKFTWAFDHMRREITKARTCEKEAIDNNKTIIATLSHDIKTPIASIRAYAEGLDANLDSGPEVRRKYCSVIIKKCDEVKSLTDDLFLHALSDLDRLKINSVDVNLREQLLHIWNNMGLNDNPLYSIGEIPDITIMLDEKRFEQVIENLLNNKKKYAPGSKVEMTAELDITELLISIRDYGEGIPDEDMPFIFHKFYRGKNAADQQGSGLGLYIVKYIIEQLGGSVNAYNMSPGLKIILRLPYHS